MWKPPERIKHVIRPGTWPSAREAASATLFTPLRVGPMELAHRGWVPAMVPWRANAEGFVTDAVLEWYERFASGRPAALVVEATGIRDVPSGPLLRIGDDRFIQGLSRLVETVHRASHGETKILIQLIDFLAVRRRPQAEVYFKRFLEITDQHRQSLGAQAWSEDAVRDRLSELSEAELQEVLSARECEALWKGYRERVTDTHLPHVADLPSVLPGLFAEAAGRARTAGFDGVELHYAHAYTMSSLLSALNDRDDGYGGSRENRVRLPMEVFSAVRDAVGDDLAVGCRMLSEDCIEGGSTIEDAIWFATEFAGAGMDFISVSRGGRFEDAARPKIGEAVYPYTGPSGYECMPTAISDAFGPVGRNIEPTARIRAAVREAGYDTPIVVAGGIHGFELAESLLTDGMADLIGLARQSLADPDWFLKLRLGAGDEIRVCEYTNYCEGLDQKHKPVTCKLWDRVSLEEPGIRLTADNRRRMTAPGWRG